MQEGDINWDHSGMLRLGCSSKNLHEFQRWSNPSYELVKSTTFSHDQWPETRFFWFFMGGLILTLSKPLFGLHCWGGLWPRMRSRSRPTCTSRDDVGWPKGFWTSENCCTYTWCPLIVAGSAKISCLLATWIVGAYHRWHSISKRGLLGCLGHFDLRGLPGCNSWRWYIYVLFIWI